MPSEGSPSLEFSAYDWKSVLWTLLTAAIAAVLTAIVDSVLPDMKDQGLIDATLFTLLTTLLHAARKYLTDTRVIVVGLLLAAMLILPGAATAEEVGVVVDDSRPGSYLVTVAADRAVSVVPFRVVRPGASPSPPPTVPPVGQPPGSPSPFEAEVERITKEALAKGGTATTGAALSSVYSLVADEVLAGRIAPASALPAIKAATDLVLAKQADGAAWATWRQSIGDALTILNQQGQLGTRDQVWAALRQIANGLNKATGFNHSPQALPKLAAPANGILDGVNLAQLMELIKLIVELLKLFGVGK